MNLLKLSASYIRQRWLTTGLNVLLLALGIATIVVLLLFSHQLERNLTENAEGIDLVVGAKGSPLQLILSSIYHIDAPTGNIPVEEAQEIIDHPAVAEAIPLALGDSYRGYRIVGTTHDYAALYGAELASGARWSGTMTVTAGARVAEEAQLRIGDEIVSSHGLTGDGAVHESHPLQVVGVLEATGTVIDRLLLTSIETVWAVHGDHTGDDHTGDGHSEDDHSEDDHTSEDHAEEVGGGGGAFHADEEDDGREYTSLLLTYSSPIAAATFPRYVNSQTDLQAAAPAFQTARLMSLLGVGFDALRGFGILLIAVAAVGVFVALYSALRERRYDLAVMRTLGASRWTLLTHVILEGVILTVMGTVLGLGLGHAAAAVLSRAVAEAQGLALAGWSFVPAEAVLAVLALGVGVVAALVPAVQAYRTDIAQVLARR